MQAKIAPMPPALAAALNEEALPKAIPELVAELMNRSGQIDALMREGNLSEVWLPAMGTKTVALALESHAGSLPAAKRSLSPPRSSASSLPPGRLTATATWVTARKSSRRISVSRRQWPT